eukprot:4089787-Prymnesium_polylepis.1
MAGRCITSDVQASRTFEALRDGKGAYARVLWRVKVGSTCTAAAVVASFLAAWWAAHQRVDPFSNLNKAQRGLVKTVSAIGCLGGFPISGLAVLPTDERAVRNLNRFMARSTSSVG